MKSVKFRWWWLVFFAVVLIGLILILGISIGSTRIPPAHVFAYLVYHLPFGEHLVTPNWTDPEQVILAQIRVPRTVVGFLVGASLSVAGVAYQGVLRNPLADPYTLGVSSGASVGAAGVILLGWQGEALLGQFLVPIGAFAGACLALWMVLSLGA